jgi:hypothetical protein
LIDTEPTSAGALLVLPTQISVFVFGLVLSLFQVMEKYQRRPSAKTPAVMKPSSNPTTPGIKNRGQSRRDRKMALQQDVRSP